MTNDASKIRTLRDAFGAFATGVTVVAANNAEGQPVGFTANSFTSVSLDPPMLLICIARTSRNFATMMATDNFSVSVLSKAQRDVSDIFARPAEDRFDRVDWRHGENGAPVIAGVAAWFECDASQRVEAGDHVVILGRITAFGNSGDDGLGYVRGSYFTPAKTSSAAAPLLSVVVEHDRSVFLLGDGPFSLPGFEPESEDPVEELSRRIAGLTGLDVTAEGLFSVYSSDADGRRHVVYRARATSSSGAKPAPDSGRFVPLEEIPSCGFATTATRDVMTRYAVERAQGRFSVYFGNEAGGDVLRMPHHRQPDPGATPGGEPNVL